MVRIYNETEDANLTIQEFIDAYDADDTDVYYVQFIFNLKTLFDSTQEKTALRGKHEKDEQGNSLLDRYAITVDEESFFDRHMELGSGEMFRKLLAWTKNVFKSYQYNVGHDFEEAFAYQGEVSLYQSVPAALDIIHDYNANFVAASLVGMQILIESGPYKGYARNITDNLATSITAFDPGGNFPGDISGEAYSINNVSEISLSEPSLQFFLTMPNTPYFDLFENVEAKMEEALALYVIKEWYRTVGLYQDAQIEEARYDNLAKEIKSLLMMKADPTRRRIGFWKSF